jgi:cyclic pyranopterin phosphate synthase
MLKYYSGIKNNEYIFNGVNYPKINISSGTIRVVLLNNCNYGCSHCFREGDLNKKSKINNVEFIIKVIRHGFLRFGIRKVKLTGGEPLLYPDLEELLKGIVSIGITDIDITTNGYYILDKIHILSEYNVKKITVTLNTLEDDLYQKIHICNKSALQKVLEGLDALRNSKMFDVSLNIVPLDIEEQNIMEVLNYSWLKGFTPRLCEPMHIANVKNTEKKSEFSSISDFLLMEAVEVIESKCSSISTLYLKEEKKVILLKNLCDRRMCDVCQRYMYIRLTSDGKLKPCLARYDTEVQIPNDPQDEELERCFVIASNEMGNGLDSNVRTGLSFNE